MYDAVDRFSRSLFALAYRIGRALFGGMHLRRRFPLIAKMQNFLSEHSRDAAITVNGYTLYLDVHEGIDASAGFEEATTKLFEREIRPGNIVLDIGADVGYYTCLAAKLVGPTGHVFAFEPNPRSSEFLNKNIATNGFRQVTLVHKALSDARGTLPFFDNGPHSSLGYDRFNEGKATLTVEALPLDEFFGAQIPCVDFIKMDVEGSEGHVFRGMQKLLTASPNARVVVEFYPQLLVKAGEDPKKFLNAWERLGFTIYDIDGDFGLRSPVSIDELLKRYPQESERMTNLFLRRSGILSK